MDFCSQLSCRLLIDAMRNKMESNLVVSPLSSNVIFNLTAEGSRGHTLKKLLEFLDFKKIEDLSSVSAKMMSITSDGNDNSGGPIIQLLDGVWIDKKYSLKPSHEEVIRRLYKGEIKSVDFKNKAEEIVKDANDWAKASTKGLVTDVLKREDLNQYTSIILGNALYFKGNWKDSFRRKWTRDKRFYLLNGEKVRVPFMTGCETYSHNSFDGFELVKIPYQSGRDRKKFSMYIFLPNERNGLENLLQKAASDSTFFRQDFKLHTLPYDVFWIPKFKFSYRVSDVLDTMTDMGWPEPFDFDCEELETGRNQTLIVENIVQKAFIEIDEAGAEAAAVTFAMGEADRCSSRKTSEFVADHPFMFMIREEERKIVLFAGAVLNPLKE